MKGKYFAMMLVTLAVQTVLAQGKYVLSGYVSDDSNLDPLLYASVISSKTKQGVVSNGYGFYSLQLTEGTHRISVSYMGYQTKVIEVNLTKDTKMDIGLVRDTQILEEVTVSSKKKNENISILETAVSGLKSSEIESMPVFLGEKDPLKAIVFLPGVKEAPGVTSNFFVERGKFRSKLSTYR